MGACQIPLVFLFGCVFMNLLYFFPTTFFYFSCWLLVEHHVLSSGFCKREMQEVFIKNNDKFFEVSITIVVGCSNIFTNMFIMMEKFTNERYMYKLYALERQGTLSRFHMQMDSIIFHFLPSTFNIKKKIDPLGWDDVYNASLRHQCVHYKMLKGIAMYTYTKM